MNDFSVSITLVFEENDPLLVLKQLVRILHENALDSKIFSIKLLPVTAEVKEIARTKQE